ncbi:radical SAM protein [Myxococcota bacterium]|nr:radical SAM protein [Myxococcota bacterium]
MDDPFDRHAVDYDAAWGRDPVAAAFRDEVHATLARHLPPGALVLDAGCGIGLDALRLQRSGHRVVAMDASAGMVAQARARGVDARVHRVEDAGSLGPVDAALLDFGVINCLAPVAAAQGLAGAVRPGGVAVVVPMPRLHPTWTARCLARGDLRGAVGRLRPVVEVPVAGGTVRTRYLSGRELARAFSPWFEVVEQRGLGFFTPPPGSRLGPALARVERPLRGLPLLRSVGDHLVVVLRRTAVPAEVLPAAVGEGRLRRRRETRRAQRTGEVRRLRVLVLHLTDGCNSRCAACDFRGPAGGEALTAPVAARLAREARAMGCGEVLLTGGEPLLRPDLEDLLRGVRLAGMRPTLLTNGLLLRRHAALVARWCEEVVVSLDGCDPASYRAARGVDGFAAVQAGVLALRAQAPGLVVRARVTVTAANQGRLLEIAQVARDWGLAAVSFLAADLEGDAFGRASAGPGDPVLTLRPDPQALRRELAELRRALPPGFLSDSDAALDRIWQRARADQGLEAPRSPRCDAPWTSVVVQPDLSLRPCFFLDGGGADARRGLAAGLHALAPRLAALDIDRHPTCQRCVCWARLG